MCFYVWYNLRVFLRVVQLACVFYVWYNLRVFLRVAQLACKNTQFVPHVKTHASCATRKNTQIVPHVKTHASCTTRKKHTQVVPHVKTRTLCHTYKNTCGTTCVFLRVVKGSFRNLSTSKIRLLCKLSISRASISKCL